ncbi:unnamed protein product [Symbiodinium microadriaticum]|nr:unnamed protein product [Symbiodinium microadriaticum]
MGATPCAEAPRCRITDCQHVDVFKSVPVSSLPSMPSLSDAPGLAKCCEQTMQHPSDNSSLFECWDQEVDPDAPLKEFTYMVESSNQVLLAEEQQRGNLSHRSCDSDIERQEEFSKHKQKVEQQRADRLQRQKLAEKRKKDLVQNRGLQERYRSLGVNIVSVGEKGITEDT